MSNNKTDNQASLQQLVGIMDELRGPGGCPWDKEQTADTIKGHLIEEAYEVIEAINKKDYKELKEELGDLLLQIVFHSQIAKEEKKFELKDVIIAINKKLIRRHPHIFAEETVSGKDEVLKKWEEIKKEEKKGFGKEESFSYLDGVPVGLPALYFAHRLQTKAARVGFDWQNKEPVIEKLKEELSEFEDALKSNNNNQVEKELGDILFSVVNIARKVRIDAETSLMKAASVFNKRFRKMEELAKKNGEDFAKLTMAKKEKLWEKAKLDNSE